MDQLKSIKNFKELLLHFPRISLASSEDSQEILELSDKIQMQTESGGLKFDRGPDFFALSRVQAEKCYTFLFRNENGKLTGYGCISLTAMQVKGVKQYLGYNSDLRFSREMEKETKIQFYKFYEILIRESKNIEEMKSCQFIIASILDGNKVAQSVMVHKRGQNKGRLIHRPFYSYTNINVLGTLSAKRSPNQIIKGNDELEDSILNFLTYNQKEDITWTREEILRRKKKHGFSWSDFYIIKNENDTIKACCSLLSDFQYRKAQVSNLNLSVRASQFLAPFLGKPKVRENSPLRLGYLSFLKIEDCKLEERADILSQFFHAINCEERSRPKKERFHSVTLHEPAEFKMGRRLLKRGHLNIELPATLYQVAHEARLDEKTRIEFQKKRPDFDVVFH